MSQKILIIRFSSLGDVVLTTALLPNIKAHWPEAEVSVLTKVAYAPVFSGNPHLNHVWIYDPSRQSFSDLTKEIRMAGYDIIIDLQGNLRSWLIRLVAGTHRMINVEKMSWQRLCLVWLKKKSKKLDRSVRDRILDCLIPLEIPLVQIDTQLFPTKVNETLDTFSINKSLKLIGIAPGAKHKTKQWSPEKYAEAANRLGAVPESLIVLLGDKSDQSVTEKVARFLRVPFKNTAGFSSLEELTALLSSLSVLITNDSGIMHMAEALKVPLVALFGPTVRAFGFAPYRESSRVVEVINLPCRPCTLHGDDVCPLKHHQCMEDIDVNAVLYAASPLIEKPGDPVHENSTST